MADSKKPTGFILFLAVIAVLVAGGYYYVSHPEVFIGAPDEGGAVVPAAEQDDTSSASTEPPVTEEGQAQAEAELPSVDLAAALKERVLGNPDAPIKISEHASLTCSHCAHFHKDIFEEFKKRFIDSGRAYLVYSDFPLNAPALHATMIGRCLPEENYFSYLHKLFTEQEDWAFSAGYLTYLRNTAAEFGMQDPEFDACIKSKELQDGILERMKMAQKLWNINATPSFVINNKTTISGAKPIEEFEAAIEAAENPQPEGEAAAEENNAE